MTGQHSPLETLRAWRAEIGAELEEALAALKSAAAEREAARTAVRTAAEALRAMRAALGQIGPNAAELPGPLGMRLRELEQAGRGARNRETAAAAVLAATEEHASEFEAAIARLDELLQQPAEAA